MNILIIGSGGREHALAWKAAQSPLVDTVYVAPGNAGTALEPGIENAEIDIGDFNALKSFALNKDIGLTIVGPEAPLVDGIGIGFQTLLRGAERARGTGVPILGVNLGHVGFLAELEREVEGGG